MGERDAVIAGLVADNEKNERFIEIINAAQPEVLWAGMTTLQHEKWMDKNRGLIGGPLSLPLEPVLYFTPDQSRRPKKIENTGAMIRQLSTVAGKSWP